MPLIEIVAVVFGLACVGLTIRRSILCWPTGLVQVVLSSVIFWQVKLYSDFALQLIYVGLQIYGWREWLRERRPVGESVGKPVGEDAEAGNPAGAGEVPVGRLSGPAFFGWAVGIAVGSAALGGAMKEWTDAALPFGDAFTTVASLAAQWLLAKRAVESWLIWIAVDVVSIANYYHKDLHLFAGLYAVFLVMATAGYFAWRRAAATGEPVEPPAIAEPAIAQAKS
ncbi:nicotinamide riboside transporter PnuC [Alienimonas californiensis]|uniref:Nicotinamide riboside transporter PnuC n=1 Tax=Alienimonas californiensis TaxID=2527989 RepID=A0A517P6C4_9PLAN|nr:nicotinamide riboside transporter PnuC [Alienimonas californiensis]QDT14906.1 Nicotinamide riboside transporter PnuC [Alienimonas californiensis]